MFEQSDESVHRLEGSQNNEPCGLIIKKKSSDHTFKKPQGSVFGLDRLAEKIRKEKEKNYRSRQEETPTYTGGVDREARERLESRLKRQRLTAYDEDRDRKRSRNRSRDRDRKRDRSSRSSSSRESSRQTPRFRDEPQTPKFKTRVRFLDTLF